MDFAARVQGVGNKAAELQTLLQRETELDTDPDPEIDAFMKASLILVLSSALWPVAHAMELQCMNCNVAEPRVFPLSIGNCVGMCSSCLCISTSAEVLWHCAGSSAAWHALFCRHRADAAPAGVSCSDLTLS